MISELDHSIIIVGKLVKVNKSEVIRMVSEDTGIPQRYVSKVLDSAFEVMTSSLSVKEPVMLSGFGKFYFKKLANRKRFIFETNRVEMVEGNEKLYFKPSDKMIDRMKRNE